jgi:hypothetical protein
MARTGRPPVIDAGWAVTMEARGWTHREIAEEVSRTSGQQVTRPAVSMAIKAYKARSGQKPPPRWPWDVLSRHARGAFYQTLVTVWYWEQREPLTEEESQSVRDFLQILDAQEAVMTYSRLSGWHMVSRQPEDDRSYFQERSFDDNGNPILR